MKFVPGFEKAILEYVDKPDSIYYVWHPYLKKNGELGNRAGSVLNHYHLMNILRTDNFDIYDVHLSIYHFLTIKNANNSVTGLMPDIKTAVVNKVFFDIDPPQSVDLYKWQQSEFLKLREFQKIIPCRLHATGRGYLIIIDLSEVITINQADFLQKRINEKYHLETDEYVPITPLRVFKLPYTKNSKTNTWVLPIEDQNDYQDICRMQRYSEITGRARWLEKSRVKVSTLMSL